MSISLTVHSKNGVLVPLDGTTSVMDGPESEDEREKTPGPPCEPSGMYSTTFGQSFTHCTADQLVEEDNSSYGPVDHDTNLVRCSPTPPAPGKRYDSR